MHYFFQRSGRRMAARFAFLALLLALLGCALVTGPPGTPTPAARTATGLPATRTKTLQATPTLTRTPAPTLAPFACGFDPVSAEIVQQVRPETWLGWVRQLSGADPVVIAGQQTRITSRYTPAMFGADGRGGLPNARAFEWVEETVRAWYPAEQVNVQPFSVDMRGGVLHGKNLILTLPGTVHPDEAVILSAHLDSTSHEDPEHSAPGAEDNASGSAALLEAARLFRNHRFERTIRIIWFTGEEQGMLGSRAYVDTISRPGAILGVINLDMFGFDTDGDRCFEMHIGTLPQSERVARCFAQAAAAHDLGLETYDHLTSQATDRSDHGSFWGAGVGAIEILENMFVDDLPRGCTNGDPNPGYHSPQDTFEKLNPESAARIVQAALAGAAAMAGPVE